MYVFVGRPEDWKLAVTKRFLTACCYAHEHITASHKQQVIDFPGKVQVLRRKKYF